MGLALMCLSLQALRYCIDRVEKPLNEAKAAIAKKNSELNGKLVLDQYYVKGFKRNDLLVAIDKYPNDSLILIP